MYSPFITLFNSEVISDGGMSVRNPSLPRFIPKIGISYIPKFLAQLSRVPSPPMAIIRSLLFITDLSEIPFFEIYLVILEEEGNKHFIPKLVKTSITWLAIE